MPKSPRQYLSMRLARAIDARVAADVAVATEFLDQRIQQSGTDMARSIDAAVQSSAADAAAAAETSALSIANASATLTDAQRRHANYVEQLLRRIETLEARVARLEAGRGNDALQ